MTSTEKIDILSELEIFLQELEEYRSFRLWKTIKRVPTRKIVSIDNLRNKLLRDVGRFRLLITELSGKEEIKIAERGDLYSSDIWLRSLRLEFDPVTSNLLDYCIDVTNVAIGKLEDDIRKGYRDKQGNPIEKTHRVDTEPPKAFISHGKETAALTKVEDFLRILGIDPLIVKDMPSLDKTLGDKVDYYLGKADFIVILATGEDKIKGKLHPRQNVIHEIGLAQKTHPGKIIYLLEENTEFPSNISPKVWERFKQRNMLNAFLCILRELRALGILLAVKPQDKEHIS